MLITIDEVTNSKDIRIFTSAFQIFLREGLPVFLLMTGLYAHIERLRNAVVKVNSTGQMTLLSGETAMS